MFLTNNFASLHLWWKENLIGKTSKSLKRLSRFANIKKWSSCISIKKILFGKLFFLNIINFWGRNFFLGVSQASVLGESISHILCGTTRQNNGSLDCVLSFVLLFTVKYFEKCESFYYLYLNSSFAKLFTAGVFCGKDFLLSKLNRLNLINFTKNIIFTYARRGPCYIFKAPFTH